MRVAAVTMAMSMQSARRAAEAAIGRAAVRPSVRAGDEHVARAAIPLRHEAHRHRADGRASHQRQHHTTRAFHGLRSRLLTVLGHRTVSITCALRQVKASPFTASCGNGSAAGKTKGMRKRAEAAARHATRRGTGRAGRRMVRRGIAAIDLRDDPPPPWPPPDEEDPRGGHSALLCTSDGEGTFGGRSQLSRGIKV